MIHLCARRRAFLKNTFSLSARPRLRAAPAAEASAQTETARQGTPATSSQQVGRLWAEQSGWAGCSA